MITGEAKKDIQDHLRTLHFLIATASVVLLLAASTSPEIRYMEARKQLAQIGEILGAWDGDFLGKTLSEQMAVGEVPVKLESERSTTVSVDWPSPLVYWGGSQGIGWRGKEDRFKHKPKSLRDFFSFWDSLLLCRDLDLPRKLHISELHEAGKGMVPQEDGAIPEPRELMPTDPDHAYGPYFYRIFSQGGSIYLNLRGASPDGKKDRFFTWRAGNDKMGSSIGMSVFARFLKAKDIEAPSLVESSIAFSELKSVFRDLDSVNLEQASTYLDQLATSSDAVELFGIKIPAEAVALWGLPLFLAVQIYFCLLLQAAARFGCITNMQCSWLGLLPTLPAVIVTTMSAVIAPPLVHVLIGVRVLASSFSLLSLAGIGLLFVVSVTASIAIFRAFSTIRSALISPPS